MDKIMKKLEALGVPSETLETLKEKLGDNFLVDVKELGLKGAVEKAGLDTSSLPDISVDDVKSALATVKAKLDTDGDGKVEVSDVVDKAKDVAKKAGAKAEKAKDAVSEVAQEALGNDIDGDGKTGIKDAVENVKESALAQKATEVASDVKEKASDLADKVASTEVAQKATEVGKGIFSKIKSFFTK